MSGDRSSTTSPWEKGAYDARDHLAALGIDAQRISTISYGKEKPFDHGHDATAWRKMIDEGYMESHDAGDPLARVRAAEAMTEHPLTIAVDATLAEASRVTTNALHRAYPVVESDGRLAGIVRRNALDAAVSQGRGDVLVRELMEQPKLVATGTEELIQVVRRMEMVGVDRCPVVDDDAARRVIGFLGPSDILRARIARSRSAESEFELFE